MHGFPSRNYFPTQAVEKTASFGHGNRHVRIDTAVDGDAGKTVLVSSREFAANEPVPEHLFFDGQAYRRHTFDQLLHRYTYTLDTSHGDVHEGLERLENEGGPAIAGRIGVESRRPSLSELKNTEAGWPIGGDRPDPGVEVSQFPHE